MGLINGIRRQRTKAEITEAINTVNRDIERGKGNISQIVASIKRGKVRVKELEVERDMAFS